MRTFSTDLLSGEEEWDGYCRRCGCGVSWNEDFDPPTPPYQPVDVMCWPCALAYSREEGAAVAFGLIGMAEAIRDRYRPATGKELAEAFGLRLLPTRSVWQK